MVCCAVVASSWHGHLCTCGRHGNAALSNRRSCLPLSCEHAKTRPKHLDHPETLVVISVRWVVPANAMELYPRNYSSSSIEVANGPKKGISYRSRVAAVSVSSIHGDALPLEPRTINVCLVNQEPNKSQVSSKYQPGQYA